MIKNLKHIGLFIAAFVLTIALGVQTAFAYSSECQPASSTRVGTSLPQLNGAPCTNDWTDGCLRYDATGYSRVTVYGRVYSDGRYYCPPRHFNGDVLELNTGALWHWADDVIDVRGR